MIKLERIFTPIKLSPKFIQEKTDKFKLDETNVWNISWLKIALLKLSNDKCAYCECALTEESKYMEVEHFEDKANNPDKVLEWNNLLPSCKRCNGSKSTHDVILEPIINPFIVEPKNELYFRLYKIKGKSDIGINSEEVLSLNDTERAVQKRFEVGEQLEKSIEVCDDRLKNFEANSSVRRRNKLMNILREILLECQPSAIYSATCATVLHSNEKYKVIKSKMSVNGLWNNELTELHNNSLDIVLEIR